MPKSKRLYLGLIGVAVIVLVEALRLAGIEVSDSAKAEVLAALAALVAADCWRPLGGK